MLLISPKLLPFVWEIVLVPCIVDPRLRGIESREDELTAVLGKGGKGADFFVCIHFHNDLG